MSSLRYFGRQADSDASLATRGYIDNRQAQTNVTQVQVDDEITAQLISRATKSYIDAADAGKALKTYVDARDNDYVLASKLGASDGVAKLSGNTVPTSILKNAPRGPRIYYANGFADTGAVLSGSTKQITSFQLTDPGYKWYPLVFGNGFETRVSTAADCRPDLTLNLNSLSGTVISAATGKIGTADTMRSPMVMVPDAAAPALTGAANFYLKTYQGYGAPGAFYLYAAQAWLFIIQVPVL